MRTTLATYRIQFTPTFGFSQCEQMVAYLARLGISDIYASPILKAKKGSTHGYDVVDPTQLNPELGTGDDFNRLADKVRAAQMGWVQDIVPNHMAYDSDNHILTDILEKGPASRYSDFLDIEWDHTYETLKNKLLVPFLGKIYVEALECGEIQLQYDKSGLKVCYYELRLPLKIESYLELFMFRLDNLQTELGSSHPDFIKWIGLVQILKSLVSGKDPGHDRQLDLIRKMLWEAYSNSPKIKKFVDDNIRLFNGNHDKPDSFNLLDNLLSQQFFRLSFWKVATEELNYRRFFNINGLISLKIQNPQAFAHTHSLIVKMVREGKWTGLRIDHIDGLYDPVAYLQQLQEQTGGTYIVVEKILDTTEELPTTWPVQGTTGYDFMNYVNGLFCRTFNQDAYSAVYQKFATITVPWEKLTCEKKRLIIGKHMAGDIDNLAHLMKKVFSRHRYGRDIALYGLRRALVEVMTQFPVYRTYITQQGVGPQDQAYIETAITGALQTNPELWYELNLIKRFLLLKFDEHLSEEERQTWLHFVMRFQQFTGPLMAKAVEDTTFYVYNRLLSLNEVGGNPNQFGCSLAKFHEINQRRAKTWPHTLNATSTHDSKRGEDVRARLNVLSEIPQEWESCCNEWQRLNLSKKKTVKGKTIPDANDEYFLYQTLLGLLPFAAEDYPAFKERIKTYIVKAVREAKVHTAWLKPDTDYENAYLAFIDEILTFSAQNPFWKSLVSFQSKIADSGIWNSLSQTLLKITAVGIPDFYQGTELWDLSLVDPDNRRAVDFARRSAMLQEITGKIETQPARLIAELLATKADGRIKLFLIYQALRARKQYSAIFLQGDYLPLEVKGQQQDHVIAFARKHDNTYAITLAARFFTDLAPTGAMPLGGQIWQDTVVELPANFPTSWQDAVTGLTVTAQKEIKIGAVFLHLPLALLINKA